MSMDPAQAWVPRKDSRGWQNFKKTWVLLDLDFLSPLDGTTISRSWRALQQLNEGSCTQSAVDPLGLEKCLLLFTSPDGCLPRPAFLFARPQLQTWATSGLRHSRVSDWSEGWRFSWRKSRDTSPRVFLLAHPTLTHNPGTGLSLRLLFPRKLSSERENAAALWPLLVTTTWKSVLGTQYSFTRCRVVNGRSYHEMSCGR